MIFPGRRSCRRPKPRPGRLPAAKREPRPAKESGPDSQREADKVECPCCSSSLHAAADKEVESQAYNAAVAALTQYMEMVLCKNASEAELRRWLEEGPLRLGNDPKSGGTEYEFSKDQARRLREEEARRYNENEARFNRWG